MVASIIYGLCGLTSLLSAMLLWRSYLRSRYRLLLWSALCFTGLAVNNVLLVVDTQIVSGTDLRLIRDASGLAGISVLLFGLIWESR